MVAATAVAILALWCLLTYLPAVPGGGQFWLLVGRTLTVGFFLLAVAAQFKRWCAKTEMIDTYVSAAIITVAALTLAARIIADISGPSVHGRALAFAAEFAVAVLWAGIALVPNGRVIGCLNLWGRAALLAMAACQALRAFSDVGERSVILLAVGAQLLSTVILVGLANAPDVSGVQACRSLAETLDELANLRQQQRERMHDARSVLTGVLGAASLLTDRTVTVDPQRLQALLAAEIGRLQVMLDTEGTEPMREFDLADCLHPVVLANRVAGARIDADLPSIRVTGRPGTTATVVDNLLRNARTHAPGARIWLWLVVDATTASVIVEDDGPGIPENERELVLLPGVRGSTAAGPGSGLGLHIAAKSMQAQSGSLQVGARPDGGTRVVCTLPLATGLVWEPTLAALAS